MRIPSRTRIERTGIVVTVASLLAIAIGVLAVAPENFVWASRTSSTTFTHSAKWLDDCHESIPVGELPEQPQQFPEGGSRISVANTLAARKLCQAKLDSQYVYRHRSLGEYISMYGRTIATTITSPETLDISELLLGGSTYRGYMPDPHVSQSTFMVLKLILYWSVRFLLVGLLLLYFEPTVGRVLRFIWRGSRSA